jgi:hypothetical protein
MSTEKESREPLVGISLAGLGDIPFRELAVRFVFGFVISAIAGAIDLGFGTRPSGLLLAFPAILPATLTLIEKDDSRKEAEDDDVGAILGAAALIVFALVAHFLFATSGAPLALIGASLSWLAVAVLLYLILRGLVALRGD